METNRRLCLRRRERGLDDKRFLGVWLLAGLAELPLLALIAGRPTELPVMDGVFLHFLAAGLIFLAPGRGRGYFHHTRHWGTPLALMTLLLPGFGWIGTGFLALRHRNAPEDKEAYRFGDDLEDDLNPLAGMGTAVSIEHEYADAMDVIPAVDALLSGDSDLQRGAIETLAKIQSAESIGWIMRVRSDTDPEIRFYATTALTRLKHDFETAIRAAEKEAFGSPGEISPQVALQRVRFEYAITGMLDPDAQQAVLLDCREKTSRLIEKSTEAARLAYRIERVLDPVRAVTALDDLEERLPENSSVWVRERAELLFSMGRHREVRDLLAARGEEAFRKNDDTAQQREWESILYWWTRD